MSAAALPAVTKHAEERMAKRSITESEIEVALEYGRMLFRSGVLVFFLGRRDADRCPRTMGQRDRLEGLTVISDPSTHTVITAYRNASALRRIRRQPQYRVRTSVQGGW